MITIIIIMTSYINAISIPNVLILTNVLPNVSMLLREAYVTK